MIVNFIAVAAALVVIYRAMDEVMGPLERSGASDSEIVAMVSRFLRVMGGTALLTIALVALAFGEAA